MTGKQTSKMMKEIGSVLKKILNKRINNKQSPIFVK